MNVRYEPRNDFVVVSIVQDPKGDLPDAYYVEAVGPLANDLRKGDRVTVMETEEGPCFDVLDEEGTLAIAREHCIMAVEHVVKGPREGYEDFHS